MVASESLPYHEVGTRTHTREPMLPLLHYDATTATIEAYLPVWAAADQQRGMVEQLQADWPDKTRVLVLVEGCPRHQLCGDWYGAAPPEEG